ncbi:SIP domain-containing protein [Sphingomonas bacterium]|uniref:SIP domain-containing protein n=1 Tax=Sphingomonas bacterium TaxID=1895847 RepID=UPI0020C5EAC6|nr:SIP domain-containing protein [Sphingomonas bacterium]
MAKARWFKAKVFRLASHFLRRVEPADDRESDADVQTIPTAAAWTPAWVLRDGATDDAALLRAAMARHDMPPGDGFVWIAAEASVARSVRRHVLDERGHPRAWTKAGGYWIRGKADAHDRIDD